jgi:hypothetical protein
MADHHIIPSWDVDSVYFKYRDFPEFRKRDLTDYEHHDEHFALWIETGDWRHFSGAKMALASSHAARLGGLIGGKNLSKLNSDKAHQIHAAKGGAKTANNSRVKSTLDGRVTSLACAGHWNKKNPLYIGTWERI